MYAFFYSLYMSLFLGEWQTYTTQAVRSSLTTAWDELTTWLMNALGGEFATAQTMTWTTTPETLWALALALITLTGLCWLVWKLTRGLFGIFFGGWRR